MRNSALVLLSGGLDSATCFLIAKKQFGDVYTVSFDYGQKNRTEIRKSQELAKCYGSLEHFLIHIDSKIFSSSSLTSSDKNIPLGRSEKEILEHASSGEFPSTYVPARNLLFLSYALSIAQNKSIPNIFIGVNIFDYSGYPDCRPDFVKSFMETANLAVGANASSPKIVIHTPLLQKTKSEIILTAKDLGLDFDMTISCYQPINDKPCETCDACVLRKKGFIEAGI